MKPKTKKRIAKATISAALVTSSISTIAIPSSASTTFSDLNPSNAHYNDILNLSERGIINGYPDETYRPNVAITRGQAAKIIAKILNLDTNGLENPNFTDVNVNDQFYPYIAALVKAGIISGYSDNTFKPTQTITRGQMAKMIAIGFNLNDEIEAPFTDVSADHPFANYVNALFSSGVTTGKTATTFDLNGDVTRGQLASFVVRAEQAIQTFESTVTGTIEQIQKNSITVNGKKYNVHKDMAFLLANTNKNALLNAKITFNAKNNEIFSATSLSVVNGSTFDGQSATIDELKLSASVTTVKNVTAETIHYAVNAQSKIENVTAKKLVAQTASESVASLANTVPSIDLIINGSTFEIVQIIGAIASLQKTASTITDLQAGNVSILNLQGDFNIVSLSSLVKLTGTAIIKSVHFANQNIKEFNPSSTIQINNVIINGQTYTWQNAVNQFITPTTNNSSNANNNSGENSTVPSPGNTGNNGTTTPGNNEETNTASPGETEENKTPSVPDNNSEDNDTNTTDPTENNEDNDLSDNNGDTGGNAEEPTSLNTANITFNAKSNQILGTTVISDIGATVLIYADGDTLLGQGIVDTNGQFEIELKIPVQPNQTIKLIVEKNGKTSELQWSIPDLDENSDDDNTDGDITEGGNTGENTDSGNTDGDSTDGENTDSGNTDGDSTDGENTDSGNTDGDSTDGENTDSGNTDGDNTDGENTDSGNTDGDSTDGENTNSGNTPPTSDTVDAQNIDVVGDTIQLTDSETNETISYKISYNIQTFFSNNSALLSNVKMDIENGEVTAINAATINANTKFDGDSLGGIEIETLTLNNASTIENMTNVENLIVSTSASELSFNNVSANITATGSFEIISGAAGDSLTISSTVSNVIVNNVTSTNVIINENTSVAQRLAGKKVASVANNFLFANETKMTITFADGTYKDQSLTVNRKDTIVDIEGTPFSKITIANNNIDLLTNGTEVNRLVVTKNVSYLRLEANVTNFEADLAQALVIHSDAAKTINHLFVKAPTTGTEGWLDFVNVTVKNVTLNDQSIITETGTAKLEDFPIFKNYVNTGIQNFSAVLERNSFGIYKLNGTQTITHYVLAKTSTELETYKNLTTLPVDKNTYTDNLILYADTVNIVAYNANSDGTINAVSVIEVPSNVPLVRLDNKTATGDLTYFTRFYDNQTPSETLKTIYIFKNGSLSKATNVTGTWKKTDEGLNSITVQTGVSLNNTREVILGNNILSVYGSNVTTYASDYVKILKKVAELSVQTGNTNLMNEMLKFVYSKEEGTYNSFFLSKYINAINENPSSLTSLDDFSSLINKIDSDNSYDKEAVMTASDLYLTGSIQNTFTYSNVGIIKNSLNDKGELLFNALKTGETTVQVTDSNGLATLVHIIVNANKQITTQTVLATDAPTGTLLEGSTNFRYAGTKLIATAFAKENGMLKNAAAIIQQGENTTELTRVTLISNGSSYEISAATTINPVILAPKEFGLNQVTNITSQNIGFKILSPKEIMFYPRYVGSELIFITDGTNEVAVNTTTNSTIDNLTDSIARSNTLAIESELNLLSVNDHVFTPNTPKNVFLYNNGSDIQVFAKDAYTGSVKLIDSANTITLVNVESTKVTNKVAVKDLEVVKTSIAADNSGATVQHIDNPVVRAKGLELYAIGTGTATVTLSNGKQYTVTVNASNGVYSIEATIVQNLNITATELHMTDIKEVLGASSVQYVKNNSEAIISLADTSEAVITLISTNNEKTIIKVTKDVSGYKYDAYRSIVSASDVGLATLTDAYNVGNIPTTAAARAKVATNPDTNTKVLYIYNTAVGNQTFRVTDGTKSTAINVKVTADGNGFTSTPVAVTHTIPDEYELVDNATTSNNTTHLNGKVLYATGLGLNSNNKATIEVPMKNGANYVIGLTYDADTGLYSFDQSPTVTFTLNYSKEKLGLDTLVSATTANSNIIPSIVDGKLNIAVTANASARIEVTGTVDNQTAKTFIYIDRSTSGITAKIERVEITNADNEIVALDLNLKEYGYTTTPTGIWTVANVARATFSADFKANFYALNTGKTGFKLTDSNGKALLINVTADANNPRGITAKVEEAALSDDLSVTGTIIEGDGVRLSADKTKVYAAKVGATSKVKLSNNTYVLFEVTENADGQYVLTPTPLTSITTITAAELGLTGNITANSLDTTIVTKTEYADSIVLTGIKDGKTAMLVTDSENKSVLVNITVNGNTVTAEKVKPVTTAATPTLLPDEPTTVVRINGTNIYAIGEGTVRLLVDDGIHEVHVTKTGGGHYAITEPVLISGAVLSATDLGFSASTSLEIEVATNTNFYIGILNGEILAYSKLTGATTGSFEFVVKAADTSARTLVRLNDKGTDLLEHQVAKKAAVTFDDATSVTFNDANLARFDANADILYLLATGSTFVTAKNHLHAVDITRDADGYLQADVRQLSIDDNGKTFTKIANTDENIIEVTSNAIYAKALGTTRVKLGNDILTVSIGKDTNGQYQMTSTVTTSQFVAIGDAGITSFETAEVISGTADAVSLNKDATGLTIYSNGATTAQSLLIRVADVNEHKALINVTIDASGAVTKAEVVKNTLTTIGDATETVQTDDARAVWNGTTLTVYALKAGNSALKFMNSLVNVTATADGNKVNKPTIETLNHGFTNPDVITNGTLINDYYFTAEGTGLVYSDGKVYSISATKTNGQYVKTISTGSTAITFDLTAINGTVAQDEQTLNSVKIVKDTVKADSDNDKLVIYAAGEGVSEITITQADGTVVYQTKATASSITAPKLAVKKLDNEFIGATVKAGNSIRLVASDPDQPSVLDTMYFLKEGTTSLIKDGKLINVTVTRDEDGFFTTSPEYVTTTVKEEITEALNDFIVGTDKKTLYAKNDVAEETFYTENYRVTAKTTLENGSYVLNVDQRHMNTFDVADYFTTGTVTVKALNGNTNANAVLAEVNNGKLIVYAGATAGNAVITFTNGTKDVAFNVIHGQDGTILATPQATVDSLKFADIGLSTTTNPITLANEFDPEVAEITVTNAGLTINAKKVGTTSVALEQNGVIVGLVNIKVESVSGNLKITSTPVTYEVSDAQLTTTMATDARAYNGKYYATSTGSTLYGADTSATSVVVSQNTTTGLYNAKKSAHNLAIITANDVDLDKITHISVNGTSVEAVYNSDNTELYIYGMNNGTSDVVASNGTQFATIVTKNGATLVTDIARKQLDSNDQLTGAAWTTNFVEIRNNTIYATHAGKGVATTNIGAYNALMNIEITRKSDQTFAIQYDVVDHTFTNNVTVLSGTSIKVDGKRIFAQQVGISTIEVGSEVYTVEVTKNAEGLYNLAISAPVEAEGITATDLGLSTITKTTIAAITGAGVVEASIVTDTDIPANSKVILQAKYAGEAQVTITDGVNTTIVHVLVENQNGKLVLTPTIAKLTLDMTPLTAELTAIEADGIFRVVGTTLFALKEGSKVVPINGELHKLVAKKTNNILLPADEKITMTLLGVVSVPTSSTVLTANANQITAIGFGTETVTIDGTRTFRITVNTDGTILSEELVAEAFDLKNILNASPSELVTTSAVAKIKYIGTTATIEPITVGSTTMTISDGTSAIQVKVTVTDDNGTKRITTEIPSSKFYTGTLGLYPTDITMPNNDVFTSKQGVVKLVNGEITVYPGEIGTSKLIIKDANGKKALYELTVNDDYSYSFAPFKQTVGYDAFKFQPEIIKKVGNAYAKIGVTGLDISFEDTEETIFIVKGDVGYKILTVQAEIDQPNNTFSAKVPKVYEATTVAGEVTNVKGLQVAKDGETSILYADKNTKYPASYTFNGTIYEVVENTDPNVPTEFVATPLSKGASYTSGTFVDGTDVVKFEANEWITKAVGTGMYKVNDNQYIAITVEEDGTNSYIITEAADLFSTMPLPITAGSTLTNAQVIAPNENVYVDGNTVFGSSSEMIAITATLDNKKVLYTGKFDTTPATILKKNILDELGWSILSTNTLNENSSILRIEGNEIYALGVGEETITFTSPNGIQRTFVVKVTPDFDIVFEPVDANTITYVAQEPGEGISEILFTFTMNVSSTVDIVKSNTISDVSVYSNEINIGVTPGITAVNSFTLTFQELSNIPLEFTITIKDVTDITISSSNPLFKFVPTNQIKDFPSTP
ncbi:hypothetical protein DCE79_02940 [Lysinibacillus sp. 2017]|uniref:S-layer homology domain-containing protein n=1 Tax=unclassified Lysinibacillus TaxID=2636778 RepID=UPI000D52995D|nr:MULTISPECIES: S-layer homology domain-containing protein [unclassified Lysinibacillus]AWE06403.1 hypothetical protein DCE79_02940 [Lysinibacillus sp. 2017]TGN33409.1 hypothetical protein E4L99_14420 [Lysinibacillus sp. S2017]